MRNVRWVADSRERVRGFPKPARKVVGEALQAAQSGLKHIDAKPLRGVGSGVLEIVARYNTQDLRKLRKYQTLRRKK